MRCERAQELLWPMEGPRATVPEEGTARLHLSGCKNCQRFFRRDSEISRILRRLSLSRRAPAELRGRTLTLLAETVVDVRFGHERRYRGGRFAAWSVAAAAVALLATGLWTKTGGPSLPEPHHYAADFSWLMVEEEAEPLSLDPATVEEFFRRKLGYGVVPVRLDGAVVTRAMICFLDGRRGARIEYELGGRRVAYYRLLRADEASPSAPETGLKNVRIYDGLDVPVLLWGDAVYEHALVGNLSSTELGRLVEESFGGV